MRAVRYHEQGGPDVLTVEDVERPDPGDGEVRVEVRAAGVNPVDTYFREGSYDPPELPMIPGSDFAGVVDAVGDGVTDFAEGDRVFGTGLGNDRQGTYAEFAVAPTDRVARLPDGADFAAGAAVALVGVTAWRALVDHAGLDPAETCLIHGGSGGVGHVAVQLADSMGARVVTTASEEYHAQLEELGADAPVEYDREDLADVVVEAAGRPDVILDHRLDQYLDFDAEVGTQGVRVVGIGNTEPAAGFENVAAARGKEMELRLMSMFNTPDMAAVLRKLARLLEAGDLEPRVSKTYDLDHAADAQKAVLRNSFLGKLVIEP
ncbi:NADPH:quinone reductase [Halorussus gelatinilyticus]|uniref:NADPH:quinone reductase n=1 Tax=Halorussus gelatinilyticus TaxID=2937524 RepID=A0A8U0IHX6_9EURY|nr:NADPH:quinone reductase [Halorussus gelatinilyticus]UPW00687.1 NADPH:quinone reductase [Halorussus gelatinilyticus]